MSKEATEKKPKAFVSYVSEDRTLVHRICAEFSRNSIDYWLDRENIAPGRQWKKAIADAITGGACFVACFSGNYMKKAPTYMNEELLTAIEVYRQMPHDSGWLLPVKLSECQIPDMSIAPGQTLRDLHYISLYDDWDLNIRRVVDAIRKDPDFSECESFRPDPDISDKMYIYQGLKALIQSSGCGFHNNDRGHPVYVIASSEASEDIRKGWKYADSPERNRLFQLLSSLTRELLQGYPSVATMTWWYDFSTWRDFCRFAVAAYYGEEAAKE